MGIFSTLKDMAKDSVKEMAKDVGADLRQQATGAIKNKIQEKLSEKMQPKNTMVAYQNKNLPSSSGANEDKDEEKAGMLIKTNWAIITKLFKKVAGNIPLSTLDNDTQLEKIFRRVHSFLPPPLRLVIWKKRFVKMMMKKKDLLKKVLVEKQDQIKLQSQEDEAQELARLEANNSEFNNYSDSELEYLEELEELYKNDGQISEAERRLLDRIRKSLDIEEDRAKEIENELLSKNLFSESELEYIEEIKFCLEDGNAINEAVRKMLYRKRDKLNIPEDRAIELENMFLNKKRINQMFLAKIKNGKVEIVNERGMLQHSFGSNACSAMLNDKQDLAIITYTNGKVDLTNIRGVLKKTITTSGANNARFMGDDIAVETSKGKTEIRSQTGILKKTI